MIGCRIRPATAAALVCVAVAAGCGFGPGPSSEGTATLAVTRDYGSQTLVDEAETDPHSSETVIRFLDREADITTRYGGGFVQSIDGLAGAERAGRRYDWFFYVNGIESPVGAAEVHVHGGDRIWWDYRDWTGAMQVPAVVGSWPEPFTQAAAEGDRRARDGGLPGRRPRVRHRGPPPRRRRGGRARRAEEAGRSQETTGPSAPGRARGARCAMIRRSTSCVVARRQPACSRASRARRGAYHLIALDSSATPVRDLGPDAGLVAALRSGDDPPTWLVTGSTGPAVRRAASSLDAASLRQRYAVAAPLHGPPLALPLDRGEGG